MIEYLKNPQVAALIEQGTVYQKSAKTLLRRPTAQEVGQTMVTYVLKDGALMKESETVVQAEHVVARNAGVLGQMNGQDVYNEWPIPMATAVKNYGQAVIDGLSQTEFQAHKKQATVKGITLTPQVMQILGVQGDTLEIKVSWSDQPMVAKIGACLTSGGYCISENDMKDYEVV